MDHLELALIQDILMTAIREDVGSGDVTSKATIPSSVRAAARYVAKQEMVVSGLSVVGEILMLVDPDLEFREVSHEGEFVSSRAVLAEVRGKGRSILAAERTSLNFLQRMCGIATMTRKFVDRIAGTRARIVDTRKTAPGLRHLDKYAVTCGGGMNHRMGLFDGILVKNNHLAFHRSIPAAIHEARCHLGHLVKIELEVRNLEELGAAVESGADVILLDNFTPQQVREAVNAVGGRVPLESSGGITLETVRNFAETGVDYISVGALTHSVVAADIHLRVIPD